MVQRQSVLPVLHDIRNSHTGQVHTLKLSYRYVSKIFHCTWQTVPDINNTFTKKSTLEHLRDCGIQTIC